MNEEIKVEYQEIGQHFRQYTSFLLSIMQHFIAGNVLLFAGLTYAAKDGLEPSYSVLLLIELGFFGSVGALIVQIRTYNYWSILLERGTEIETNFSGLIYTKFKAAGDKRKIRSAYFAFFTYSLFSLFWLYLFLKIWGVL